jgi:tRNA G18 (ribose-2'-O)-methylase SpoU
MPLPTLYRLACFSIGIECDYDFVSMYQKLKLAELARLSLSEYQAIDKNGFVVFLDNVRSMHNVGSVFRTCDAFRVEKLYLAGITPCPPHREIHKTALGAELSVDWAHVPDGLSLIQQLKKEGYCIISVEQTTNSELITDFSLESPQKICLIFGNEVEGVAQNLIEASDYVLEIPQFGTKHSLNISGKKRI